MDYTKQEQDFRLLMQIWAGLFAAAGIVFFAFHEQILALLDVVGGWLGFAGMVGPAHGGAAVQDVELSRFWMVLVLSLMGTLALMCYAMYRNPRTYHIFVVPLLVSKFLSALFFFLAFLLGTRAFGYLVGAVTDGAIFALTLVVYGRTDLDEQLAGSLRRTLSEPVVPLWSSGEGDPSDGAGSDGTD